MEKTNTKIPDPMYLKKLFFFTTLSYRKYYLKKRYIWSYLQIILKKVCSKSASQGLKFLKTTGVLFFCHKEIKKNDDL